MIRKRFGTLFILLFFLAVLTGGILYDDLSGAGTEDDPYQAIKLLNETIHQISDKYVDPVGADSLYFRAIDGLLLSLDP